MTRRLISFAATIIIAVSACLSTALPSHAQQKSVEKLKKEKQVAARQIKETTRKLKTNTRETQRQLNRLETLRGDMQRQTAIMARARHAADSVNIAIEQLGDTIAEMDSSLVKLQTSYGKALRRMQSASRPATALSFIMSSESFEQAYQRVRYLRQFTKWRRRKGEQVKAAQAELALRRDRLAALGRERNEALQRLDVATRKLKSQQTETESLIASLKKEEGNLRALLKESENKRRKLDNEIDRLIRQEQERQERKRREAEQKAKAKREAEEKARRDALRQQQQQSSPTKQPSKAESATDKKPERQNTEQTMTADPDRKLTGSFESNKGKLLFPVSGNYRIIKGFGRQPHPELKHVETDNSGIDIETAKGAKARAVFDGTVSAIFRQPGFNTIVMVRHGEYITIYAGLADISVKNGDKIKTGQTLGTVVSDPDNDNRSILHFELRRERQKLNPTLWVK